MTTHFAIAIDGPAASGKSTIARELAKLLKLVMVNSGEMYRAVTWQVLLENIAPTDTEKVVSLLEKIQITCGEKEGRSTIAINGKELSHELRTEEVNKAVSTVSAVPQVREKLVALQRDYLRHTNVVMEGRDIGSVVFPDTPFKIYVDANEQVRAARRKADGEEDSVAARDKADASRSTAPLIIPQGAIVLDNSDHTIASALEATLDILRSQGLDVDALLS